MPSTRTTAPLTDWQAYVAAETAGDALGEHVALWVTRMDDLRTTAECLVAAALETRTNASYLTRYSSGLWTRLVENLRGLPDGKHLTNAYAHMRRYHERATSHVRPEHPYAEFYARASALLDDMRAVLVPSPPVPAPTIRYVEFDLNDSGDEDWY